MKILIIILFSVFISLSQQEKVGTNADIKKLDEITIETKDVLNVKGGEKRRPTILPTLSKSDLDSLNSLEKQQSLLLPTSGLPNQIIPNASDRAFVKGQLGRFATVDAEAGYSFAYRNFDIYTIADLEMSDGHLENAGYFNGGLRLISDYVAPEKFWIFGGSKTRTRLDYNRASFNNYSVDNPEDRAIDSVALMMDVDGTYNGFQFYTGVGFDVFDLSTDSSNFADTGLKGYINVVNPYKNWRFSGGANTEIRTGNSQSNNYFEGSGKLAYLSKNIDFIAEGGLQLAQNDNETLFQPQFNLGLVVKSNNDFTISANTGSKLIRNTFANLSRYNPYISWNTFLNHTTENLFVDLNLSYHPYSRFQFRIGSKIALLDNTMNWINSDSSQFSIYYDKATQIKLFVESYYDLNDKNSISLMIENNNVITDSLDNQQTYLPTLKASIDYNSQLFDNFAMNLSLDYVGTRFADIDNKVELDPFVNLNLKFDFAISNNFNLYLVGENLLNQDIYQFNYYRQRGLFFSFGILWKF
ncbi:hypothetical protein OAQ99_01790 [Candidatus Kapabacteria bacterium]|nr:hypothetical protein [Candidatus Kapabacteria bacterium]